MVNSKESDVMSDSYFYNMEKTMLVLTIIVIYLAVMNLIGFAAMGIDKRKAKKGNWRIPEINLFLYAILGGSIGSILGMHFFHHKTRHWYFLYGMPFILILQVALVLFFLYSPIIFYVL